MTDLLASNMPLGAADLVADKKSPVSGTVEMITFGMFVLAVIFLVYVQLKRRR